MLKLTILCNKELRLGLGELLNGNIEKFFLKRHFSIKQRTMFRFRRYLSKAWDTFNMK